MKIEGHSALVTGGARGLGAGMAQALAAAGAKVMIGDLLEAADVASSIGGAHTHLDIADEASWEAAVAATVDVISGGRVQMGIGGGWYEHEWRAYGYGFPSAGVRLASLDEGVQIMRDAWRDGRVSLDGKHYQVDGAIVALTLELRNSARRPVKL